MKGPVIGITAHPRVMDVASGPTMLHTVSRFYVDAVQRAGGRAVILPVLPPDAAPGVIDIVDGIVFTGGGDVCPTAYGAACHDQTRGVDEERDAFELALARAVVDSQVASLAICRGMQVVNVALGGTLVQHLGDRTATAHDDAARWMEEVHHVTVTPDSRLAAVVGPAVDVNSIHHQGVDALAPGARAVAWAPDDTVEAFEVDPELIAVQWHPELLVGHGEHEGLFVHLVQRAARFGERRSGERDPSFER